MARSLLIAVPVSMLAFAAHAETRQALSLGFDAERISTDDARSFSFRSPSVGYALHWVHWPVGLWAGAELRVPVRASQSGQGFWVSNVYDSAHGVDVLLAATRPVRLGERRMVFGGAGAHLNVLTLNDALLRDIEHVALGAGVLAGVSLPVGVRWLGGELGWSARCELTADPVDLARGGNLAWGLGAKLSVAVELIYGD